MITFAWRGSFTNPELNGLHAEGFAHEPADDDWWGRVHRHSLGWVCAREGAELVGFVNVAWDGAGHAFVLDTVTAAGVRSMGVGSRLVEVAAEQAREAGCDWLHVDFEEHLRHFYLDRCGFRPTAAGLIALNPG
ncbi:GNAT family N-acetyltransferase [Pseudonocardia sp. TRM90224]|uniref:GNAT family N-acetyltransferase n=1 Tax=Pseudonocardia sp. TRM90224 TaxID=2812678 RepID=UPI001E3A79B9|nr:GNAT family N-acetyltransferase [Pseudonocardia sp. TRM90224]